MKIKKHTFLSTLFLFIFLTAFSSGAYASLNNSITEFGHFSKHKEVKEHSSASVNESPVFEETENDTEDSIDPSYIFLPSFLSSDHLISIIKTTNFKEFSFSEKICNPLFITIRVLRI